MSNGFQLVYSKDKPVSKKVLSAYLAPAIEELKQSLGVVTTNEPINRKEGNVGQADLERDSGKSFKFVIKGLEDALK